VTLYLTSSPCIDGADRAVLNPQNDFLDRLRCDLPVNPRCLYIASSPDDRDATCEFGAAMFCAFAEAGIHFSQYRILDRLTEELAADLIMDSDFIILAGGHVPTQNVFFNEIGLPELLQDFPGIVMGISAGSMNAAIIAYLQPEAPGESNPAFQRFAPGLGLTDINICPHYQKVFDMELDGLRLFEDITYADSMGKTFFALPDGSYFYIDEEQSLLCGEGYRIRNGILEKLTDDGDVLDIGEIR
jgi:dipeptidase E